MLLIKYLKNIGNIGQVRCLLTEQKEIATLKHNLQRAFDLLNRSEDCKYLMSEINHVQFVSGKVWTSSIYYDIWAFLPYPSYQDKLVTQSINIMISEPFLIYHFI